MKAMIVSDFAVLRSVLLQLLGICLVIALFMGYVMGAVGTAAAIAAMVPFTGLFSLAAYDEQNNWERFRLTLPLTRRQVVFGRYASIALLTVGSLALALVLGLGIAALAGLLPAEWLPESLSPSENTPEMIVGSTVGGVSVVAIAMAVAMPVITRFGMTKAARIVPIIVVLIVAFAVAFFGNGVQLTGVLDAVQRAERFLPDLFQLFFHKRMLLFVIIQKNKALRPDRGRKTRLPRYHPLFAEILRCFWPGNGGHAGAS